jgi:hypothetical protein
MSSMKGVTRRLCLLAFFVSIVSLPHFAHAQVVNFVFTSDPQTVAPATSSAQITLQADDASGNPVDGNTICIQVTSSSGSGAFATNVANLNASPSAALALTLSTTEFRRNFYYQDPTAGTYTLTAQAALRTGSSCTGWSPASGVQWAAMQQIVIGNATSNGSSDSSSSSDASSSSETSDDQSDASTTQTQTANTSAPVSSYVAPPVPDLYADAGGDRTVIVGADVEFNAQAYDKNQNVLDPGTVRFAWNFGDGAIAEGESVLHHFDYPGRYAVVLDIAQDKFAASDEMIATAEPAALSFSALPDGGVEIDDKAGHDLDLSDWIVRQSAGLFAPQFMVPDHSVILSGSSMRISKTTLQFFASSSTELEYPNGASALGAGQSVGNAPAPPASPDPVPVDSPQKTISAAPPAPSEASADAPDPSGQTGDMIPDAASDTPATTSLQAAAAAGAPAPRSQLWWFGVFGLAALAAGSLAVAQRFGKREWDIVEEKPEEV